MPRTDYLFNGWQDRHPQPVFSGVKKEGSFLMPSRDVDLLADWTPDGRVVSYDFGHREAMILQILTSRLPVRGTCLVDVSVLGLSKEVLTTKTDVITRVENTGNVHLDKWDNYDFMVISNTYSVMCFRIIFNYDITDSSGSPLTTVRSATVVDDLLINGIAPLSVDTLQESASRYVFTFEYDANLMAQAQSFHMTNLLVQLEFA